MSARTISLVVPARNEAAHVGPVLAAVPAVVDEVVLVLGPSVDDTLAVARAARPGLHVVTHEGTEKGAALRAGFAAAHGDVLVTLDADGSMDPAAIPHLLAALDRGLDLVTAGRPPTAGRVSVRLVSRRRDPRRGFLAFSRTHLAALDLGLAGPDVAGAMVASARRAGLRVGGLETGARRFTTRRPLSA